MLIGQFGCTLISMYSPEVLNTAVFGLKITHAHFNHKEVCFVLLQVIFTIIFPKLTIYYFYTIFSITLILL